MTYGRLGAAAQLAAATALLLGALAGCGGGGDEGRAVIAKAEAVDVTYYYLPG